MTSIALCNAVLRETAAATAVSAEATMMDVLLAEGPRWGGVALLEEWEVAAAAGRLPSARLLAILRMKRLGCTPIVHWPCLFVLGRRGQNNVMRMRPSH